MMPQSEPHPISPNEPRVTYLLSVLAGGTAEHLLSLLRHREKGAWNATVLSEKENAARTGWPDPVSILPPVPKYSKFPLSQWIRWRQVRKRLREFQPQILHTYFFWAIIYGRLMKARGVVQRLVENREDLGFAWGRFEYTLLRLTSRYPDRVVCVCDAVRQVVLEREKLPSEEVVVIRNGIEKVNQKSSRLGASLRREFRIHPSAPVVGMVAHFDRAVKGANYLVDCIPHVVEHAPDVRFVLVGRGSDPDELRERARKLGVEENLLLVGFRSDIDAIYSMIDVSVLASLSEGLSITILESMARGIPVVATRVGGNLELVRHEITGLLVPPGDPKAMAAGIVRLLAEPDLRSAFGEAARSVVEQEFRIDLVSQQYESLYRELVDR